MVLDGYQWLSMILSGYQWFSVVTSGSQRLPVVLNGSPRPQSNLNVCTSICSAFAVPPLPGICVLKLPWELIHHGSTSLYFTWDFTTITSAHTQDHFVSPLGWSSEPLQDSSAAGPEEHASWLCGAITLQRLSVWEPAKNLPQLWWAVLACSIDSRVRVLYYLC